MAQLFPYLLPQASSVSLGIDFVFWLITAVCFVFAVGVGFFLILFTVRYRAGSKVNRVLPHHEGIALEMIWTIIPLIIAMGLFMASTVVYFQTVRAPKDSTEIFVVGKQWMWKIQHPTGRWEMNEIHVPVGKPVKLTMISEDVIHDFGMPSFRLNMDVVPGRYTQTWFTPTRVGRYHFFCAQFCGTNHAIMGGYITVMEPDQFEKWMQTGNVQSAIASEGETLFRNLGCTGCHGPNANVRAPSLAGIYNKDIAIQDPAGGPWSPTIPATTIKADYRYLHDSIIVPAKEVAAGYKPIMPSYAGKLTESQVLQLIDYIKGLSTSNGTDNGAAAGYKPYPDAEGAAGGNSTGDSGNGDAPSGKPYGGSRTGDMSDIQDRDAVMRPSFDTSTTGDPASGKLYGTSPIGDMSNNVDRENTFHGGSAGDNAALAERAAGGMNGDSTRRGGLNPYKTQKYIDSSLGAYTGGLKTQPMPGGNR